MGKKRKIQNLILLRQKLLMWQLRDVGKEEMDWSQHGIQTLFIFVTNIKRHQYTEIGNIKSNWKHQITAALSGLNQLCDTVNSVI